MSSNRLRGRPATNVLAAITSTHWAITPEMLATMISIANRTNLSIEALEAMRGERLDNTRTVSVRDHVATIPMRGPMHRYADLFSQISGATSYSDLAHDFQVALDNPDVRAIVFDIDSPGGTVNGCAEFARYVYEARGLKPIVAYVSYMGASAAYWIASACDEIVCADTAILGSLGVMMTYTDRSVANEAAGISNIVVVSSGSPLKNEDPTTASGLAQMQDTVDAIAEVFLANVADFRGVPIETVLADYGQGGVLVGQYAVDAGLADRLGTYESLHAELAEEANQNAGGLFRVGATLNDGV